MGRARGFAAARPFRSWRDQIEPGRRPNCAKLCTIFTVPGAPAARYTGPLNRAGSTPSSKFRSTPAASHGKSRGFAAHPSGSCPAILSLAGGRIVQYCAAIYGRRRPMHGTPIHLTAPDPRPSMKIGPVYLNPPGRSGTLLIQLVDHSQGQVRFRRWSPPVRRMGRRRGAKSRRTAWI